MQESRTRKTARNIFFSIGYKLIDLVLSFVLRSVFIQALGLSYLGIGGLFTSVLNVLSLMELGVGSAIAFALYKPLAEENHNKVSSLMQLYKHAYTVIGILVCIIGFGLTPFLGKIINLPENVDNLSIIYWLFVANTVITYFLSFRRTLLIADQRSDICTKIDIAFRIARCIILILILVLMHNYIVYLAVDVFITLLCNAVISQKAKKRYPYLQEKNVEPLEKSEKINIIKYISSALFSKFGQTVVTSTDNIIISAFIGTSLVGLYSNYYMIFSSLDAIIYYFFSNITASVGNFAVMNSREESYILFKKISLVNYLIACVTCICFFCLASPFVTIWLGKGFLLTEVTIAVMSLNLFIITSQNCISNFMGAVGELYYRNRYRALIEGLVNIVISILLVRFTDLGITGVFLGTTACFLCGRMWMDARVLYKHWFKVPFRKYVFVYAVRIILFAIICTIMRFVAMFLFSKMGVSIISWILCGLCCSGLSSAILILLYKRTEEFQYIKALGSKFANKVLSRK